MIDIAAGAIIKKRAAAKFTVRHDNKQNKKRSNSTGAASFVFVFIDDKTRSRMLTKKV